MKRTFLIPVLIAASALGGCANRATVSSNLPLQRVVIYRNGIAYFERGGHVEEQDVRFKMREGAVGDFLATLAVMEKGGQSVRAAAFPIKSPDDIADCDPSPPTLPQRRKGKDEEDEPRLRRCTDDERRHIRDVVLSLDGKEHDLQVGYVTEAPVWRPSYRLVVQSAGQADLQAWGIVQNLSGEDWKNVKLTLVAGAPLAFEATLGTPVIPARPTVTDEGEVMAVVPRAETTLAEAPPPPPPPPPPPGAPRAEAAMDEEADDASMMAEKRDAAPRGKGAPAKVAAKPTAPSVAAASRAQGAMGGAGPAPEPARRSATVPSQPRNLRSLAAVVASGGLTRYDLPEVVTIPDKSATMVMVLAKRVPGETAHLFAPDYGVPDSMHHPFRVVRFSNQSGGALERGPIAVFDQGAFLGQGMVESLPDGATTTVPFALERSVAIDKEIKHDELGERVAKIENGELTIERDSTTITKYKIKNGSDTLAKVFIKHPRVGGARLEKPPVGTEDNVGTGSALVPGAVTPKGQLELVVDERTSIRRQEAWTTVVAENAVKALLADASVDADTKTKLTEAWKLRAEMLTLADQERTLLGEQRTNEQQSEETRRNLRAIEKNKIADKLRAQLTKRLEDLAKKNDEVGKKLVEVQARNAEVTVRFRELTRSVRYLAPVVASPK
jgi:hypothetical protein